MAMEFGQFGFARLSANSPFQVDLIEAHALDHSFRSDTLNRDPIGFDFALLAHLFRSVTTFAYKYFFALFKISARAIKN
jgi:hypothetical protein